MSPPTFIFAGGGTGGHVYPGLAVAAELTRQMPAARCVFACSNRPIDRRILDPLDYPIVPQPVRPLPRGLGEIVPFALAWMRSRRVAADLVGDLRPAAVLGLGGFAAGPVVCRAAGAGIPTALLNPDAVPGKANLYLARFADVIFTQFASTRDAFGPRFRDKVRHVGCPVRGFLLEGSREHALKEFGLERDKKTLVVLGGSLGAANINDALALLKNDLDALASRWQVLHITGPAKPGEPRAEGVASTESPVAATSAADAERSPGSEEPPRGIWVRRMEYCHRMDLAYAVADLVLARAGAGTVAELVATARPAVLMPYPYHADQHQRRNAQPLAEAGAAVICEDAKDASANAARLGPALLAILREDAKLAAMRQAASASARPHAAAEVAQWMAQDSPRAAE